MERRDGARLKKVTKKKVLRKKKNMVHVARTRRSTRERVDCGKFKTFACEQLLIALSTVVVLSVKLMSKYRT